MNTEQLAVNHVSTLVARCPHLTPYIAVNDKTPFTDGHIEIYSSDKKTNDTHEGRIDVQVKGRVMKRKKSIGTYSVRVSDLRAYLNMSGVLYFVVGITEKTLRARAFYAILSPFRIDEILREIKPTQQTVAIRLTKLPTKPEAIEELISFAAKTRHQNPQQGIDPSLMERIKEVNIHGIGNIDLQKPVSLNLSETDFVIFAKTEGGMEIALPGQFQIMPSDYLGKPIEGTIASGGVHFENPIRRRIDDDLVEFRLSETLNFTLALPSSNKACGLTLRLSDNLEQRLRDIGFYLGLIETRELRFDGTPLKMNVNIPKNIDELRGHYRYLQYLDKLFTELSVPIALITFNDINEAQSDQLWTVYCCIVEGLPLNEKYAKVERIFRQVGRWGLELMIIEQSNKWRLFDVFAPDLPQIFARVGETASGKPIRYRITPYEMLGAEELARTLNLHLNSIVSAYEVIEKSEQTTTLANDTVLRLIQAADIEPMRCEELLAGAERLNEWLVLRCGDEPHHIINRMQIIARRRQLTDSERRTIRTLCRAAIKEDVNNVLQIELSSAILLGDVDKIIDVVEQLSEEELEAFKAWPIWNLNVYSEKTDAASS